MKRGLVQMTEIIPCVVVEVIIEDYVDKSEPSKIADVKQLVRCLFEGSDCVQEE